ncbi:MAG: RNA recognition motif domain-containing protein [Burkholderiales bacterium]
MKLWIGNLDPAVTDDELKAFVGKYTPHLEIGEIVRVPGDGSRPAATLTSKGSLVVLYEAQQRLDGMLWKDRKLVVQVLRDL